MFKLRGISTKCNSIGMKNFTERLENGSRSPGYCLEIGNGQWDSWTMSLLEQSDVACKKVKSMSQLSEGYNIVGLSQGNIIARGLIELCDGGPPVKNYISLAGPHAGTASLPMCGLRWMCAFLSGLIKLKVYDNFIQEHLAPSGYIKIPTAVTSYLKGSQFLPKLNNEIEINPIYKERFSSLENLVLIMFEQETVLKPKETSWFGYYAEGSFRTVLPMHQTRLYTEDRIGLKLLDEAGRVKLISVHGKHLDIMRSDMKKYVIPYLVSKHEDPNPIAIEPTCLPTMVNLF